MGINVGITIFAKDKKESFFNNGLKQTTIFLMETFKKTGIVDNVFLVNMSNFSDIKQSSWEDYQEHVIDFNSALEKINVLICGNVLPDESRLEIAAKKGIKFVAYLMGNEYILFNENILFKENKTGVIKRQPYYSATWTLPHIYETSKHLFEVIYDAPAYSAPYIWSPQFLMKDADQIADNQKISPRYKHNKDSQKRICAFEPNISICKTSTTPIIISEKFYRKYKDKAKKFSMFCGDGIGTKKTLIDFVSRLESYKDKKLFFEKRYPIAWALLNHTDFVLSHQHELKLNNLYFDIAWLGFPLIHNSDMIKDLGWYYDRFDADDAVEKLNNAIDYFDSDPNNALKYLENSREYIKSFFPDNEKNVKEYRILLEKLF